MEIQIVQPPNAKIRVRLESFDHELLVNACQTIVNILQNTPLNSIGVVALPTRKRIYCVLRSPHVNKKSREQFEKRIFKRLIYVSDLTPQAIETLMDLDVPSGVNISVARG